MNTRMIARAFPTITLLGGLSVTIFGCMGADTVDEEGENVASVGEALTLGSSLGTPVHSYDTCKVVNSVTPTCTTSNAPDMSYDWTAPATGMYTFSTSNTNFDNVLVISSYSSPSTVLACKNASATPGGESVTLSMNSGQKVIITVDGYASLCGNYNLNIARIYRSCTWNGKTYAHGTSITGGATCDKWDSQTCIGGLFPGTACAGAGDCYATCSDGTWIQP